MWKGKRVRGEVTHKMRYRIGEAMGYRISVLTSSAKYTRRWGVLASMAWGIRKEVIPRLRCRMTGTRKCRVSMLSECQTLSMTV